jgi:ATP-dependent Clp protease ATP-binding subunit ClpX
MAIFQLINIIFSQFIVFLIWKIIDLFRYIKNKDWKIFKRFGLHVYTGMFGSGKTSSMVHDAYLMAKKYYVPIMTNMELKNFPKDIQIIELNDPQQIVDWVGPLIVLIDEAPTVFNARDWKTEGIPKALLSVLLQVRKENKVVLMTAQRFQHIDSQLRDVTDTVRECSCFMGRWNYIKVFNGLDYENTIGNTQKTAVIRNVYAFIQTDVIRSLYDTREMVKRMKKAQYLLERPVQVKIVNG